MIDYNKLSLEQLKNLKENLAYSMKNMSYGKYRNRAKKDYEAVLKVYRGKVIENELSK